MSFALSLLLRSEGGHLEKDLLASPEALIYARQDTVKRIDDDYENDDIYYNYISNRNINLINSNNNYDDDDNDDNNESDDEMR